MRRSGPFALFLVALGLLAAGGAALVFFAGQRHQATQPRQDRNAAKVTVADQPHYVDDALCADCHRDIDEDYRSHPMGRSTTSLAQGLLAGDPLTADPGQHFTVGNLRYEIQHRDAQLVHVETYLDQDGEPIASTMLPVAFAVGSGERGRSYLVNREDRLFMSPITWYPQKDRWDLSPGYETRNSHFNRPVVVQCLFCHTNRSHPVEGTLNTYREPIFSGHAIGCQRCHGPGSDHIDRQEGTATDGQSQEAIVNPAKLEPQLREAVCQQCHLSGTAKIVRRGKNLYDFRPGMPLDDVIRVFVKDERTGETAQFVGHVEQMHASRCFQSSDGQMGCISCHDPHFSPPKAVRPEFYRARCLDCHSHDACTESVEVRSAAQDNCIQCHMPSRPTEIRHAAITDHRILREPSTDDSVPKPDETSPTEGPIAPFHVPAERDDELPRDLALAILRADDLEPLRLDGNSLQQVVRDLTEAVQRDPQDLAAWEGLGAGLGQLGDPRAALSCFESVLQQSPRREFALTNAAALSAALGRVDQSLSYWRQAVDLNPWMVRYRAELAEALARSGAWNVSEQICRQTLELFPDSHRSRQLLIESQLAQRKLDQARSEFETWLRFRPADPDQMQAWFDNHPLRRPSPNP